MRKYPRYPKYKESGQLFPGEIPSHWNVSKITYDFDVQLGKMVQPEPKSESDEFLPYLRSANLQWEGVDLSSQKLMWFSPQDRNNYRLKPGDLLISEGGDVGRSTYWERGDEMYIQNAVNRVRKIVKSDTKFLYYWMRFIKSSGFIDIICDSSTIAHYTAEKVKATFFLQPGLEEQQSIAKFLDQKTAQIDGLIEQKEKLLDLLTEKRTAIITQAVTKGLDRKVKMKDSGIEWLGGVPEHWELKRLRFLVETNPVKSQIKIEDEELVSFVPMEAVGEYGGLNLESEKEVNEVYSGYTYFRDEDVVVAKITPCFENGKGALAIGLRNGIAFGTTELHVLRSSDKMDPKFLFYLSISDFFRKIGESWMYGAGGQKRVPEEFLKDLIIPAPKPVEQVAIGIWLETKINELKSAEAQIEASVTKLREYRNSLIASTVTGQIDIR